MADNKKEQEREELHKAIWNIANDLRGSVDGWDFKQYVLGIMFYRYISENITNYINHDEHEAGNADFDYAELSDEEAEQARADMVKTKGFFILPSQLFANVRKRAPKDENLNETLEKVFQSIEASAQGTESEDDFKGLFDDIDVNSNKLGATVAKRNDKLVKLLDGIGEMKLGDYKDNTIDAFGDAYEFLMGMYASNAGKSGGEYFTPQEVSELLTRLTLVGKTEVNKVYDPACGSGSLLLKFAKISGRGTVIRCSSMTRVFLLPGSLHRKVMPIWRLLCTRSHGLQRTASRQSYASPVSFTAAERKRRFANILSIITLLTALYSFRAICFSAQVLRPALWC